MGYYAEHYSKPKVVERWVNKGATAEAIRLFGELSDYASARYNEGGWDYVVECWEPTDVQKLMDDDGCKTLEDIISAAGGIVGLIDERRTEVQSFADY